MYAHASRPLLALCLACHCALAGVRAEPPPAAPALEDRRAPRPVARPLRIDTAVDRTVPIPPPATHHMGREIAQTMHFAGADWLVRESRQREEDCRLLLEALDVRRGQTICDMGCGNGFYTLELARRVGPTGTVYAVDIQPEMLRLLAERAGREGLDNVRPVLGTAIDPRLPNAAVDLVLCVDVYHEFSHPPQMLAAIRASLAEDGRLVLAEFRGEDPAVPIKPLHKMTKDQIRAELGPAGFGVAREFDRLPWQHLLFFRSTQPGESPETSPFPR
jgi:SAM-dependent methyltransferase